VGHNKAGSRRSFGLKLSGFVAWLMWAADCTCWRIPTFAAQKSRLFLEWNWAMFLPRRISPTWVIAAAQAGLVPSPSARTQPTPSLFRGEFPNGSRTLNRDGRRRLSIGGSSELRRRKKDMSAVLLPRFFNEIQKFAERARHRARGGDGFPTDRVELTAACEPGPEAGLGPADFTARENSVQYYRVLFHLRGTSDTQAEQLAETR